MLSLIKEAEYVFTSSYHGLVFSILFHKPFYASFSKSPSRAVSLLSDIYLSNRLLKPKSAIPQVESDIDYSKIDSIIDAKRMVSINYLESVLANI